MPLFFQQTIGTNTQLGVWHITEDEEFFLGAVQPQRNVLHPHKKLQHLAGRYLLKHLFPDFPTSLIQIAGTRKPFLPGDAYDFSISHCGNFAAALVSKNKRVGVDVELVSTKADRVRHKFLSDDEEGTLLAQQAHPTALKVPGYESTLIWSCKEAVFKWYGSGEVGFKEHMVVQKQMHLSGNTVQTDIRFRKDEEQLLSLHSTVFFLEDHTVQSELSVTGEKPLVLSFLVTDIR